MTAFMNEIIGLYADSREARANQLKNIVLRSPVRLAMPNCVNLETAMVIVKTERKHLDLVVTYSRDMVTDEEKYSIIENYAHKRQIPVIPLVNLGDSVQADLKDSRCRNHVAYNDPLDLPKLILDKYKEILADSKPKVKSIEEQRRERAKKSGRYPRF